MSLNTPRNVIEIGDNIWYSYFHGFEVGVWSHGDLESQFLTWSYSGVKKNSRIHDSSQFWTYIFFLISKFFWSFKKFGKFRNVFLNIPKIFMKISRNFISKLTQNFGKFCGNFKKLCEIFKKFKETMSENVCKFSRNYYTF